MLLIFVFCTVFVTLYGKHLHPRSIVHSKDGIDDGSRAIDTNIDGMEIVSLLFILFFSSFSHKHIGYCIVLHKPLETGLN